MIEIDDVSVAVRGRQVLQHCTALLRADTPTHLVGANGSGKTTLIRAIAGIQRYSGNIRFDGADVSRVRSQLYVCFDDAPVFPYLSGYENVRILLGRDIAKPTLLAVAPSIADHDLLRTRARKLSHGQRKRLHLLAALASGARYLVFDEALNGVDAPTVSEVAAALRSREAGSTVLFTGHHDEAYGELESRRIDLVDRHLVATDDVVHGITA
ncbi:MAG TPA: ATP-binding cassette domain-containing protein [Galbitalea sp.]